MSTTKFILKNRYIKTHIIYLLRLQVNIVVQHFTIILLNVFAKTLFEVIFKWMDIECRPKVENKFSTIK